MPGLFVFGASNLLRRWILLARLPSVCLFHTASYAALMFALIWLIAQIVWLVFGFPVGLAALAYGQYKIAAYILLPGLGLTMMTFSGLLGLLT